MTARITGDMRRSLEEESARTGRTIGQVAEQWMEAGRTILGLNRGGAGVADALITMLRHAARVQTDIGDISSDLSARDALQSGWHRLVNRALPYTPDTAEGDLYRHLRQTLLASCRKCNDYLQDAANAGDEGVRPAFYRPSDGGDLLEGVHFEESLARLLQAVADGKADSVAMLALKHRAAEASEASPALREMLAPLSELIPPFEAARDAYMKPRLDAAERGKALVEAMQPVEPIQA